MNSAKTGTFISTLRKQKSLTQKQLAEQLGITDKAISKWERGLGYPDIETVLPLAKALGVTANEILMGEKVETEKVNIRKLRILQKSSLSPYLLYLC
ncbi:helix-turn-helix transcriptional regulator [Clostridium sp. 'deep sea']|uniref:helix-turn-helix domain-containing protein n=1 Tax=Clostridium sp. 'deep sea' TaxID=2779445 RepID=UPI0018969B73|nr:helix-turn-helix transcriptional regulator [Clostridium sp. 'deep sea']QOR36791.1 helix-turn-helix transcriptional regulator [Clostridium sp. 'deep sea']